MDRTGENELSSTGYKKPLKFERFFLHLMDV